MVTTPWGWVENTDERARLLRGEFKLWARVKDDKFIFRVLPIGTEPNEDEVGLYDLDSAFVQVGLNPPTEPWPQAQT